MKKRVLFFISVMLAFALQVSAQITTSGIYGKIMSDGEEVIGATVTATHKPSGTVYRAVTNSEGRYTIQGMRVGGPYQVEITYVGHQPKSFNNVNLLLGESQNLSCSLQEDAQVLDQVVILGHSGLNATKTGAAQSISAQMINDMPTVSHSIADISRLNPQISTNGMTGSMSFAGTNNRYNSFQIDGAMNNDVFGLTSSGSNGGQAGAQPVSMETIEQIQINVAPYDVRQGGFTGGAINAITKSGTNDFHGSAYGYGNNEQLVGKHYKNPDGTYSDPYEDEKEYLFGFTLGGPIVKDKLFFFANYERANKEYPNQYALGSEGSKVPTDLANDILAKVKELAADQGVTYNGEYTDAGRYIKSDKAGLKLDWNLNDFNKFTIRWSFVGAKKSLGQGNIATVNTLDHLYDFESQTHSFIAELQSRLSPTLSNEARASYVRVRDKRTSGTPFPGVTVYGVGSNGGAVNIGNEYSSMANALDQDIYTIEDNLTWLHGAHTFTFGTHNEFYKFRNLFIQNLYGCYYFQTYDNFQKYYLSAKAGQPDGTLFRDFYYNQANVEITGDPRWAAEFGAGQLGFYAQDKWDLSDRFQLTYGLRFDVPIFFDKPAENAPFNAYSEEKGWGYQTDRNIRTSLMASPRLGFRWDIDGKRNYILRGGAGIFTGRVPFVWLSNSFSNTGVQISKYRSGGLDGLQLILDPDKQYINAQHLEATNGSQEVDVFSKNFKFAQNFRANLGFDFKLLGIDWTAEGIFSKTLNDVYYQNLSYEETGKTFSQVYGYTWDNRPMMQRVTSGTPYTDVIALNNTSKGYSYSLSLKAEKHFPFGLDLMASYTHTRAKAIGTVTASTAAGNWKNNHTYRNPNKPELSNAAFNLPHSVKASAFYHFDYGRQKMFTTTIGIIYEGCNGQAYSLYYAGDANEDTYAVNDLIFIPTDAQIDQMKFAASADYTADQQRANLKQWLATQRYLKDHRGEYYDRYADNLPFENHFDLHVAQKINIRAGKYVHSLEITADIMNVANLLNKDWGRTYGSTYDTQYKSPIGYAGNGNYQFLHDADYVMFYPDSYYSRWRGQLGVKYTF